MNWQVSHLLNEARKLGNLLADVAKYLVNPAQLITDVVTATERLVTPPPGSLDGMRALADAFDTAARAADTAETELRTQHVWHMPDVMVGVAAGTADEALTQLQLGVVHEGQGLRIGARAIRTYAESLREAIATHRGGLDKLGEAKHTLDKAIHADVSVFGFDTGIPDPTAVLRKIPAIVEDVVSGIGACIHGYEQAETALSAFTVAASDSLGYARLAHSAVPAGFSVLDVAVVDEQWRASDPDSALLTPTQWAKVAETMRSMTPVQRAQLDALLQKAPTAAQRAALLMAVAAGATPSQLEFLARHVATMSNTDLMAMLSLGTNSTGLATVDGQPTVEDPAASTTCGSTSLLLLAAQKDPLLSLWLQTGQRPDGYSPPYLNGYQDWSGDTFTQRFDSLQHYVLGETAQGHGLPGTNWPQSLGTPPWGASDVASDTGNGPYYQTPFDDSDSSQRTDLMTKAAQAANQGTPVPLYVGDDYVPRHVVLITGYSQGSYTVYDPSDGEVATVPESVFLGSGGTAQTSFGNWTHVDWIVLPKGA